MDGGSFPSAEPRPRAGPARAQARAPVVVIGAGVGGLAAAYALAARGVEVTVLEAAATPGGKMRSVPSAAGPVDAGPTVLTMKRVFEELFEEGGESLSDHVTLIAEEVLARHWWPDGGALDLFADPERSEAAVRDFAGDREAAAFAAFSADARRLFETFEGPVMRAARPSFAGLTAEVMRRPALIPALAPHLTLARGLAKRFGDPRLRQLFGRYATYVGGSPYEAPAVLGLIWHAEASGVWRVKGGMRALARALADAAAAKGARFEYGARVDRIETEGGRATAAIVEDGRRFPAEAILFNGDPAALRRGLLGDPARAATDDAGVAPRSLSAYVWSFAAEPAAAEAGARPDLVHHNVFFGRVPRAEFDALKAGRMPEDATLYVCAEDRGAGAAPVGEERFEIIMNGPPTTVAAPASQDEDEERKTCRTSTFETLARFGLAFAPPPGIEALTTPSDFARLFPGSAGSLYGRSPHGLTATFRRPTARTAVAGLYLAGGGAHPGAGVPMAALSGRRAAEAIFTDLASTSRSRRTATPGGM
ncbi:MAG: 1-hydroxycarotenoid 3,4-desaturase CrtD [Pseudomonadota bacterium]